eukprot:3937513-Rhodomonas_salina.1
MAARPASACRLWISAERRVAYQLICLCCSSVSAGAAFTARLALRFHVSPSASSSSLPSP